LQEERLRRTLQRELPRITDELRSMLTQVSNRFGVCCVRSFRAISYADL
jgi:hypothetical protein